MTANTQMVEMQGCVQRPSGNACRMSIKPMVVRFTSDGHGESLSVSIEGEVMLQVPYGPVEGLVKRTRQRGQGN